MKKIVWLVREYENNYGGTEYSPAINFWFGTLERLGYEVKEGSGGLFLVKI